MTKGARKLGLLSQTSDMDSQTLNVLRTCRQSTLWKYVAEFTYRRNMRHSHWLMFDQPFDFRFEAALTRRVKTSR